MIWKDAGGSTFTVELPASRNILDMSGNELMKQKVNPHPDCKITNGRGFN